MKIVFHDVDGCLNADINTPIPIGGEPLSPNHMEKLKELGRKIDASSIDHLVINTGRSIEDTLPVVKSIASRKLQYIVGEHGAVFHDVISDKQVKAVGSIANTLELIRSFIAWYRETGSLKLNQRIGAVVPILDKAANLTLDARESVDSQQVYEEIKTLIHSEAPFPVEQLVIHHSKADGYVDVMGHIHKGDGVEVITSLIAGREASTDALHSMAIGNGLNDMPMLEAVTTPICPANAEPEVRKYCHSRSGIVSEHNFIDATLRWLDDMT